MLVASSPVDDTYLIDMTRVTLNEQNAAAAFQDVTYVPCAVDGYLFPCRAVVPNVLGSWKGSALSHRIMDLGIILVRRLLREPFAVQAPV